MHGLLLDRPTLSVGVTQGNMSSALSSSKILSFASPQNCHFPGTKTTHFQITTPQEQASAALRSLPAAKAGSLKLTFKSLRTISGYNWTEELVRIIALSRPKNRSVHSAVCSTRFFPRYFLYSRSSKRDREVQSTENSPKSLSMKLTR